MSGLSTKHMILGLVVQRSEMHGYALQTQVDRRFGFLELSGSAIYSVLKRLQRDGLIEQTGRGRTLEDRRLPYRATPEGVAAFREWMAAPSQPPLLRDELQAKLGLASPDDLPNLLHLAENQLATCVAALTAPSKPSILTAVSPETPWGVAAGILANDYRSQILAGTVDWLTSTVEVLKAHIARQAERPT